MFLNVTIEIKLISHFAQKQVEVFNLLFVKQSEDMQTYLVHCLSCAKTIARHLKGFVVLNQYETEDLMKIYDSFTLVSVTTTVKLIAALSTLFYRVYYAHSRLSVSSRCLMFTVA